MEKTKILILDDNDLQRSKFENLFSNQEGIEIVGSSNDGFEGLKLILDLKPDLVIMDMVLQNYDGFELLEKIKNGCGEDHPKILVVSSLKGEDFASKAIELGANYYMVKPIMDEVLIKRVKATMNSEEPIKKTVTPQRTQNRALDEKITNVFLTVGIPAHIKGYQFLREAVRSEEHTSELQSPD